MRSYYENHYYWHLARLLNEMHIKVKIIEKDSAVCERLSDELPNTLITHGDGTNSELLAMEHLAAVDSFFESSSGLTTTGSSVLTAVEGLPHGVLFWLSFTHWIGGMGFLVFKHSLKQIIYSNGYYAVRMDGKKIEDKTMIIGRLEIYPILLLLKPDLWKKN